MKWNPLTEKEPVNERLSSGMIKRFDGLHNQRHMKAMLSAASLLHQELEEEGFKLVIDSAWFNINPPGGENKPHTHPGAHWSGVYYVDKPEGSGHLQLYDQITQRHPLREPRNKVRKGIMDIKSETGGLIMFPAWLQHSVDVNTCKNDRISISFNAVWRFTKTHPTKTYVYD